jgi:hypothetical protein
VNIGQACCSIWKDGAHTREVTVMENDRMPLLINIPQNTTLRFSSIAAPQPLPTMPAQLHLQLPMSHPVDEPSQDIRLRRKLIQLRRRQTTLLHDPLQPR